MNGAFARSVYPVTPGGATERVCINVIEITNTSPMNDGLHDGGWFVTEDYRKVSSYYDPLADVDWGFIHELSHQVGLIDLYNLDTYADRVRVLGREGLPVNFAFGWRGGGVMFGGDTTPYSYPPGREVYSSHSAGGISSNKGYRSGYYGDYLFDIPRENYLLVLDAAGEPASGVEVALYYRDAPFAWSWHATIDNHPDISGTTGLDGRFLLENRSAGDGVTTRTGHVLRDNPFGVVDVMGKKDLFLLRLSRGDHEEFAWLMITDFNLAYWQGDVVSHTFTISSHVPPPESPAAPRDLTAEVTGGERAALRWQASPTPGVVGYYVYRASPPDYIYKRASNLVTDLRWEEAHRDWPGVNNRVYVVTAVDSAGRESGFSNFVWAPELTRPTDIGLTPEGMRVVLENHTGQLIEQLRDGRWVRALNPRLSFVGSFYLTVDRLGRILVSRPGDGFVQMVDTAEAPGSRFGERGTDLGQLDTPTGVATWGEPCQIEGPYTGDEHTLLLLHFDGTHEGVQGEKGTVTGTTFTEGKYGLGLKFGPGDTLEYPTAGNLAREQGAIEFWVLPQWEEVDRRVYPLFVAAPRWNLNFNSILLLVDGGDLLRFVIWDQAKVYGLAHPIGGWAAAGEWHHVAATWTEDEMALYVDGVKVGSRSVNPPDSLADTLSIGTGWESANAVLDEFRISDIPRVSNSDTCNYGVLVADSGNHRVQAFDAGGNFVAAFGEFGHGPGQFDGPQGLAVDALGRVIVVDGNNNRLQVLGFDGARFNLERTITAGLKSPRGVAAYGTKRIVVADTGNRKVKVLNAAGALLAEYAAPNDGHPGGFLEPFGVAVDREGSILVADSGNGRVVAIQDALPVIAMFHASPLTGVAPLDVAFVDESWGKVTGRSWDFGDGITSTLTSPVHTYTVPGTYTVTLTVRGTLSEDTLVRTNYVSFRAPVPVQADFSASPTEGLAPLTVHFYNTSTGDYDTSLWDFGDGITSTLTNPIHTYITGGVYTVTLTVSGKGGSNTHSKNGYITVVEMREVRLPLVLRNR